MEKNFDYLKDLIRTIPDFPEKGILFRDITTLLKNKKGLKDVIDIFTERYKDKNIDYVLGADARGFIFGAAIAYNIGAGFIPVRKKGKLPYKTISADYTLEYGTNSIEIHEDAIEKESTVVIVDDLLATGGTARAMIDLVDKIGAKIHELAFMIELKDLNGVDKLNGHNVFSILKY
ncbi:adenine phosphoribosyltransferase [Hypnocyclicus thermotrophus]|uniref:Adenine phosphoribosyltransferase n=1 Tax=Hypnocyclicus thermotrophus TaxID=1627895 RepID=A0AA46I5L9_9FUSO|nr:adenine phosphoribosyltransferase [Hypnocyclicus thermotrophus]TDT68646.1 adenine phosphoribosyltransferase [Hypnocyclicus thermotrophus]